MIRRLCQQGHRPISTPNTVRIEIVSTEMDIRFRYPFLANNVKSNDLSQKHVESSDLSRYM